MLVEELLNENDDSNNGSAEHAAEFKKAHDEKLKAANDYSAKKKAKAEAEQAKAEADEKHREAVKEHDDAKRKLLDADEKHRRLLVVKYKSQPN